jgi:integrase
MPLHLLSPREVQVARDGHHDDGGGLFLRVSSPGASWVFRYTGPNGVRRTMGLGSAERASLEAAGASLKRARDLAQAQRQLLDQKKDPLDERRAVRDQAKSDAAAKIAQARAESLTLCRAARDYHERVIEPRFTYKHSQQWIASLENNVPAAIWNKPINRITPVELFEVLAALRKRIPESSDKIRQRLDKVFDDAAFFGRCTMNPVRMVRNKVSETPRGRKEGHYAALPFEQVPAFVQELRAQPGTAARALEFALLTAARTGEVLGAVWEEFDIQAARWRVPPERMKAGEEHLVFLSPRALAILEQMNRLGGVHVFPSPLDPKRPLSSMAMLQVLKRMGYKKQTTVHGVCRASFSTWANDTDAARPDVIEACLAHRETDIVRAAYNRAAFHAERETLLRAWADFCDSTEIAGKPKRRRKTAAVIPFPKRDGKKTA